MTLQEMENAIAKLKKSYPGLLQKQVKFAAQFNIPEGTIVPVDYVSTKSVATDAGVIVVLR